MEEDNDDDDGDGGDDDDAEEVAKVELGDGWKLYYTREGFMFFNLDAHIPQRSIVLLQCCTLYHSLYSPSFLYLRKDFTLVTV